MTLTEMTIADIQRALAEGELSAREIARQTLDDMARVNPQINAWTQITERRMLAEADQIDAPASKSVSRYRRWRGPYAVKNLFDVAGNHPRRRTAVQRPPACRQ
jgi:aspartyl-tRNA(Asn)/glutamyl-tRNA(Gln) amidotransferase subunit A